MRQMELALCGALVPPHSFFHACKDLVKATATNQATVAADVALTAFVETPESESQSNDPEFMFHSINVINLLLYPGAIKNDSSVFHKALVDRHVAQIAVETLLQFSTPPNHDSEYSEKISFGCLQLVCALLASGGAFTQVTRMLNFGLLKASQSS